MCICSGYLKMNTVNWIREVVVHSKILMLCFKCANYLFIMHKLAHVNLS